MSRDVTMPVLSDVIIIVVAPDDDGGGGDDADAGGGDEGCCGDAWVSDVWYDVTIA